MPAEGLTKKDEAFIDEYFVNGFNATKAYLAVFKASNTYNASKGCAWRLMAKDHIKKEIEKRWREMSALAVIKREELLITLKETMHQAIDDKDPATLLKTIEIINKMCGHYTVLVDATVMQTIKLMLPGVDDEPSKDNDEEGDDE